MGGGEVALTENHSRRRQRRSCCEFHAKDRFSRRYTPVIPNPPPLAFCALFVSPLSFPYPSLAMISLRAPETSLTSAALYTHGKVTSASTGERAIYVYIRIPFPLLLCHFRLTPSARFGLRRRPPSARRHAKSSENSRNFSSTTDIAHPSDLNVLDEAGFADTFWDRRSLDNAEKKDRKREVRGEGKR